MEDKDNKDVINLIIKIRQNKVAASAIILALLF